MNIYITTTLPYVNAEPHIGFALEIVQADTLARYYRLIGCDVIFNTGTDEHGQKIYQNALEQNLKPLEYCDKLVAKNKDLKTVLNLSYDRFIRTTDPKHKLAAQKFWELCDKNGDIYKKNYRVKYCVGCELEKTDSELVNGRCPIHPNRDIEIREEENYFFRFSRYQKPLLEFYEKNPSFVLPESRFHEIKNFVAGGLQDFSISRLKSKMPWGVPVPGDPDHVMYVWFDALVNYISTLGWPNDKSDFNKYWPVIQLAGKDNLRQQSAMWQAMLMSSGIAPSSRIIIHGFITSQGQKMSKSLGNVINPVDLVQKYGVDATRYYLLREIPSLDDGDFSYHRMEELYNADLANELGNLYLRLTTLAQKDNLELDGVELNFNHEIGELIENFKFNLALERLWNRLKKLNRQINEVAPWSQAVEQRAEFLQQSLINLREVAYHLKPFLPDTSERILQSLQGKIRKGAVLFPPLPSKQG